MRVEEPLVAEMATCSPRVTTSVLTRLVQSTLLFITQASFSNNLKTCLTFNLFVFSKLYFLEMIKSNGREYTWCSDVVGNWSKKLLYLEIKTSFNTQYNKDHSSRYLSAIIIISGMSCHVF